MKILDTTVRDGSYSVNFKFSCEDVKEIVTKLEKLNMDYIEIGHGLGLDASSLEYGYSLHTDVEYMKVASENIKNTPFGFFCIPGIAKLESLKIAKEHGVSFVRVGVNANELEKAGAYIKEANRLGLTVMLNLMKSYLISPKQFASAARFADQNGVYCVYLVDSSGGMLPNQIAQYYDEVRNVCDIKIGFHGHNNLGLAVSNTVFCVEKGFDLIDCSLQGLGRSLGNASTEMVVMTLKKMGYNLEIDIPRLLEYGYVLLRDIKGNNTQNPLDLICGYADFHSSNLKYIYQCCNEYYVDPLRLILAYSSTNKKNVIYSDLCRIAEKLPKDLDRNPYSFREFF